MLWSSYRFTMWCHNPINPKSAAPPAPPFLVSSSPVGLPVGHTGLTSDPGEGTLPQERLRTKMWLLLLQKEKESVRK